MTNPPKEKAASEANFKLQFTNRNNSETVQRQKDLQNWLHCLKECSRLFAIRFIAAKLLPTGAIDVKGAYWLIKALRLPNG